MVSRRAHHRGDKLPPGVQSFRLGHEICKGRQFEAATVHITQIKTGHRNHVPVADLSWPKSTPKSCRKQVVGREWPAHIYPQQAVIEIPLTDADWERVKHLFPEPKSLASRRVGRPRRDPRNILDAILWIEQAGEKWHRLPSTFPPTQTCYVKYCEWRRAGIVQQVMDTLDLSPAAETVMEARPDTTVATQV
jgi:transposase